MQPLSLVVVDDEDLFLKAVARDLRHFGVDVRTTTEGRRALAMLDQRRPSVVLSDVCMPNLNGVDLLAEIKRNHRNTPVVLITGVATSEQVARGKAGGAFDVITKPYGNAESLYAVLARAAAANHERIEGLVGESDVMRELVQAIRASAATDASVLILGETGTGKELIARALHQLSKRASKPFVAINCSALPETLLESELFGHERGAFTGANATHRGLFEAADGGTIFLDEIGDIPLATQVRLLRVLQEREVRRVGASTSTHVDVRVIAATNADLRERVQSGTFRLDLYYRLNVIELRPPPLRARGDDAVLLAQSFATIAAGEAGRTFDGFSDAALRLIRSHSWPGNVRELQNAVQRAVLMSTSGRIESLDVEPATATSELVVALDEPYSQQRRRLLDDFHRRYLHALMERSAGNLSEASRLSGIDRANLRRMLSEHGMRDLRGKESP